MPEENKPTQVELTPETLTQQKVDPTDISSLQQKQIKASYHTFWWQLTKAPLPIRLISWLGLLFFLFIAGWLVLGFVQVFTGQYFF